MKTKKIGIVGLGYVGLPLAIEFGKKREVIGYDINESRISELKNNTDLTLEISKENFKDSIHLNFTSQIKHLNDCQIYIITVPTPIDSYKQPDLNPLIKSSQAVGSILKKGDIVIYESTVYPGTTEEICVPELEKNSGLIFNKDFYCGYSPERINPGDREHTITNIKKITSGSNSNIADEIDELYKEIITAGTYKAGSIKIAEAAKVIENTQRDVNIALINELAVIFNRLDIDTESVLEAAGTKWNFLPFRPGLVGGHCIGVDPYYLTHKALEVGYSPEMILAGRRLNDNMGTYIVKQITKIMLDKNIKSENANILIMGLAFKEDCPDIRNTKVIDLIEGFKNLNCSVNVYDPWVSKSHAINEYGIEIIDKPIERNYDVIILAVAHSEFREMSLDQIKSFGKKSSIIYDIKYLFKAKEVDGRL